ncbi:MAG: hypothetical protein TEF_17875 [Rhizobiales bacterium NRL2]|jgi:bacterioferritin-associated ferredoxin|nr:MAG: hypothetical protein TEF_17875 [Rhizobiales bacterium NRL2]
MYVCICNALSDDQVTGAIRQGVDCAEDLHPHLGCEVRCGRCVSTIVEMMDAELNGAGDATLMAAE